MTRPPVCIDRLLPRDLRRFALADTTGQVVRAIIVFRKMWVNGATLRVRFLDGTEDQRAIARKQALWWTEHANLTFEFGDDADAEIRVTFDPHLGAWSYIGTDCAQIPLDQPTMNLGFLDGGTAAHEFGHAIGLAHEHQNPAGGIQWNEPVVIHDLSGPPNNWDEQTIRHNVLEKYAVDQIRGTTFDPDSIMLYAFPATWTLTGLATHVNDTLSALDIAFIAGEQAYPGRAEPEDTALPLPVDGSGVRASIGQPGEEDLYRFTVERGGRYLVETHGRTNVAMRLYGPGSHTALIGEDDDSGWGMNARIAALLTPGDYYVQVRHADPADGTGTYSVRVRSQH
ncbi:M12 family metallopeptidase [Rhizomonospora bruguierae]|uniref:M12 family metallopeptidase n=1 Tax=Rhizomonospora bruguierae TaxID=1581705 RepID=UPI001BCF4D0C|nr:M12 family metallopeptidase [Micromonospora sp. NBRC 107566]